MIRTIWAFFFRQKQRLKADRNEASVSAAISESNLLETSGDLDGAELCLRQAQYCFPRSWKILAHLGRFLLSTGKHQEATHFLEQALSIHPEGRDISAWLGQAHFASHEYHKATQYLARAHTKFPLDTVGICLLATAFNNTDQSNEAEVILREGLRTHPEDPLLHWTFSLHHLLNGNWECGFKSFEQRFAALEKYPDLFISATRKEQKITPFFIEKGLPKEKKWQREQLHGKHLLLWAEQGLGDSIMMLRYLPLLKTKFGATKVSVHVPQGLLRLAEHNFDEIKFITSPPENTINHSNIDFHCSLMSLPFIFFTTTDTVPYSSPYIAVPEQEKEKWKNRLENISGRKIGLVWSGFHGMPLDDLRSIPFETLQPLINYPDTAFFSLQIDPEAKLEIIKTGVNVIDLLDQHTSLTETAALIQNMDLVISVDTALAHLAGAMGKPVWLLNRKTSEWRWLKNRHNSLWYPSMKIFTQSELGNWNDLIYSVKKELIDFHPQKSMDKINKSHNNYGE